MNGCIYRTKDGECDLYSEGGKFHAFCVDGPCEGRKPSNADRIRTMTDEELAHYANDVLANFSCPPGREYTGKNCKGKDCSMCWLDWLRQEADT